MSFEINGKTWVPESAQNHANNIISTINTILQENNITDDKGNVLQLSANFANAMYLLALGLGNRIAEMDEKLTRAINSFNVELCDDQQIENLLPIAAISRNSGSYSTLNLVCTASEDGMCIIPTGTRAPFGDVNFIVQNETIISAGSTAIVATVCDTLGPVVVLTGEITEFENVITNLESVTNTESAIPGVSTESINTIRQRLTKGEVIKYSIEGCKQALEELTGIGYARVYFNYNIDSPITLPGGVVLQPRHAYIVVAGSSDKLADTYATYMNAPTQNSPIASGKPTEVTLEITASAEGEAILPIGTSFTYNNKTYEINEETTIPASTQMNVLFICTEDGPNVVPAVSVFHLDQEIANVENINQSSAGVPGYDNPAHSQDWSTSSGQLIPIYYDNATEQKVYVKIYLKEGAEVGNEITNQLKRDLITASAEWGIGEDVTSLLAGAPFTNITYTEVAYVKVSTDGITYGDVAETGCNVIPEVVDGSISVEQLS